MNLLFRLFLTIFLLGFSATGTAETSAADPAHQVKTSTHGIYEVTIDSYLKPLQLGRMHAWTADIRTADGSPVKGARIRVGGGMPIHNHGFPTEPEATMELEDGVYLIEGFKFSMRGPWVILLHIEADGEKDSVAFDVKM